MNFFNQYVFLFVVHVVFAETEDISNEIMRKSFLNMLEGIVKVNRNRMDILKKLIQMEDVVLTQSDMRYLYNEESDVSSEDEARHDAIMSILDYLQDKRGVSRVQPSKDEDVINVIVHPAIARTKTNEKIPIDQTSTENVPEEPQTMAHTANDNSITDDEKIPIDETSADSEPENEGNVEPQNIEKKKRTKVEKIPIDQTSTENVPEEQPQTMTHTANDNSITDDEKIPIDETSADSEPENEGNMEPQNIPKKKTKFDKIPIDETSTENKDNIPNVQPKKLQGEIKVEKESEQKYKMTLSKDKDPLRKSWMKTVKKKGSKTCIKACKATHKNFCRLYSCSRRAKKTFIRECKLNCKAKFRGQYDDE